MSQRHHHNPHEVPDRDEGSIYRVPNKNSLDYSLPRFPHNMGPLNEEECATIRCINEELDTWYQKKIYQEVHKDINLVRSFLLELSVYYMLPSSLLFPSICSFPF